MGYVTKLEVMVNSFGSVGLNKTLAFTSDTVDPHKKGFIYLDLDVIPPSTGTSGGTPNSLLPAVTAPSGLLKKRAAPCPPDDQPSPKKATGPNILNPTESKAMEAAFKQLRRLP